MLAKYASIDRVEFNRGFLESISVFYADLGPAADKQLRCRYEHALYVAVENYGQNIPAVGHIRSPTGEPFEVIVDCSENIEALCNEVLSV